MSLKSWYSAQCIFLHADKIHGPQQMYEERIVVLRAESMEAAIERAEKEAKDYCGDVNGCSYIGYVMCLRFTMMRSETVQRSSRVCKKAN